MKATSMCSSPPSMARARPPCVVMTTGAASTPRETASATGPDMYAVVTRLTHSAAQVFDQRCMNREN